MNEIDMLSFAVRAHAKRVGNYSDYRSLTDDCAYLVRRKAIGHADLSLYIGMQTYLSEYDEFEAYRKHHSSREICARIDEFAAEVVRLHAAARLASLTGRQQRDESEVSE